MIVMSTAEESDLPLYRKQRERMNVLLKLWRLR